MTHGNFWWNHVGELYTLDVMADDRLLVVAPVFHIGGLNVLTLTTLLKGGHVVLHRAFDPARALQDLQAERITTFFAVPAILLFIHQQPGSAAADLSALRLVACGGAPCPEPLLFRTGDVGYRDADGCDCVCDRVKDMIITGGENVYPAEVESVLAGHPAIAVVAVVGAPDAQWGETVVAVVALKAQQVLELEELQGFAGEKLARYKMARRLVLVQALPRNPTGKVLKYQLRHGLQE